MNYKLILFILLAGRTFGLPLSIGLYGQKTHEKILPADSSIIFERIENRTFDLVNEHRKKLNLPLLIRSELIVKQARQHSAEMASGKVPFGHDGARRRLENISKTLEFMDEGAENVFECSDDYDDLAAEAVKGWLESEGHRENIEGDYNLSGIGIARALNGDYYFTQIFVNGR